MYKIISGKWFCTTFCLFCTKFVVSIKFKMIFLESPYKVLLFRFFFIFSKLMVQKLEEGGHIVFYFLSDYFRNYWHYQKMILVNPYSFLITFPTIYHTLGLKFKKKSLPTLHIGGYPNKTFFSNFYFTTLSAWLIYILVPNFSFQVLTVTEIKRGRTDGQTWRNYKGS